MDSHEPSLFFSKKIAAILATPSTRYTAFTGHSLKVNIEKKLSFFYITAGGSPRFGLKRHLVWG
jgi:hypothetical protein